MLDCIRAKTRNLPQCIVKATKRDTIPPLLFDLGVDLDQTIGSKWLVRHLSRLGFSITPDEVTLYRQSVLEADTETPTTLSNGAFIQWSADNVDHNLATLDGNNTFHGMGIVASVTPTSSFNKLTDMKRLKRKKNLRLKLSRIGVPIFEYDDAINLNSFPRINPLNTLKVRNRFTYDLLKYSGILVGIFHLHWSPVLFGLVSCNKGFPHPKIASTKSQMFSCFQSLTCSQPIWHGSIQQLLAAAGHFHYAKSAACICNKCWNCQKSTKKPKVAQMEVT